MNIKWCLALPQESSSNAGKNKFVKSAEAIDEKRAHLAMPALYIVLKQGFESLTWIWNDVCHYPKNRLVTLVSINLLEWTKPYIWETGQLGDYGIVYIP